MTNHNLTLRMATPKDAPAMLAIYTPYVIHSTASWEFEPPTEAEFTQRICAVRAAGFAWLMAERAGQMLGYAYASRYGVRRGYDFTAETSVYLDEAAAGRGVGRALYNALLALLRTQGYMVGFARVTYPNPESEAFHTAMGFTRESCFSNIGYKNGQWLGLVHFRFSLCTPPPVPPAPPVSVDMLPPEIVAQILVQRP